MLLVDKPPGISSHDVVARVRRALGVRRIGHAGTLDPFATGLLVLLVGRATRLLPHIDGDPKEYDATIRFAAETDTDDATGTIIRLAPHPGADALDRAIVALTGPLDQLPPAYSAKKVAGRRAYAAARRGEVVDLKPARVTVHGWTVRERDDEILRVSILCSGGTYVRALALDLGRLAGSAAHLTALRRLRSGPFRVADAQLVEEIGASEPRLRSPLEALPSLPVVPLGDDAVVRVTRGMPVHASGEGSRAALVDGYGELVAIAERAGAGWQPRVVLRDD